MVNFMMRRVEKSVLRCGGSSILEREMVYRTPNRVDRGHLLHAYLYSVHHLDKTTLS